MSTIHEMHVQAELALAAYANLTFGISGQNYIAALQQQGEGMSPTQAAAFAERWTVVDQYAGGEVIEYYDEFGQLQQAWNPSGLSVTLFEEVGTGRQVVAVRGTQDVNDLVTDVVDIGLLGTPKYQTQYRDLATKVQSWLDTGQLQTGFTVAGHSLGGFLATGLAIEYAEQVVGTYLYNAPGLGNVIDSESIAEQVWRALSPTGGYSPSIVATIHNIVSPSDPVSPVGIAVSPRLVIEIETGNPIHNHSIVTLTDALAVHALLAKMDSTITLQSVGGILKASSAVSSNSLESVVAAVGKLFDKSYSSVETTREDLYAHLAELQIAIAGKTLTVVSLINMTAGELKAIASEPSMVATRYALKELNPFAVLGADYGRFALDLVNEATGQGDLSTQWIADRAKLLERYLAINTADKVADPNGYHRVDNADETR
ncbi:MAG: hypothetical protein Q8L44_14795, partial [Sulfuritalea sp.]|nr:hypothetical protein [Sulfuritalea sp.]